MICKTNEKVISLHQAAAAAASNSVPPPGHSRSFPPARTLFVVCLRGATRRIHQNGQFGRDMAIWFHPNLRAKFPSLILTGKREPPFSQKNIAPRHRPNHTLLVMRLIFRTGEVGVIRPDHRVWAIILTPLFEPIDLKKWRVVLYSLGLGLR
jgi:hypothetical protein